MSMVASKSPHSVSATAERVLAALEARGIRLFARIDHAAGARAAGLELADEQVLVFGDPRAGTPLMQSDARVGYELPLRLLVWERDGQTMIGYRPASELAESYELGEHANVLARMDALLAQLVSESIAAG
ncbi:MAG TPA: DUF302 domain-containing protein [Solirubrobacteraceae bacterium]|nr:DUF302 domain-containing protein [Solirubrobacteraceae bacterium]